MSARQRGIRYGAICLVALAVLLTVIAKIPGIANRGKMVVAPASLDGMVTISMSPDKVLTFITCAPYHPTFWQRHLHSTLSCAFVVQHSGPTRTVVSRAGNAHIEFQGDLLSVVFTDSSRYVFTTRPKDSIPLGEGEVDESMGIATYGVGRFDTHAAFVKSRDWTKRGSCGL
jgi:hypothetical protein